MIFEQALGLHKTKMNKFIIEPVFATSKVKADRFFRDDLLYLNLWDYHIWMGPTLEDIRDLSLDVYSKEESTIPELLDLPREEIFKRILEDGGQDDLDGGITDYNEWHNESAIILYTSNMNLFEKREPF